MKGSSVTTLSGGRARPACLAGATRSLAPGRGRSAIVAATLLAGTAVSIYFVRGYWTAGRYRISTHDAYVTSDFSVATATGAGTLTRVLVADDDRVTAGQVIAEISGRPVRSPVKGTVVQQIADVGDALAEGARIMVLAPSGKIHVVAGFKASGLTMVRKGQPVTVQIDGFPDVRLRGHVDADPSPWHPSLSTPRGSSHEPEDPRVPLRIDLDKFGSQMNWLLGLPVRVTIDTRTVDVADD